jgi:maltose alpha-D-glucosyltransferase/alpha-amylase
MITETTNAKNPLWYKDAIIYELHVRAFHDSNSDGIGDFQGLIEKLDYLSNLGVTAIWLLPFYPSPLKDDGYDIADYTNINPAYGTLEDFQEFLRQAHQRNIRVITELVINHTSDQHEWFQKSRRAAPGSFWRDFYVWSDNPSKYKGTRIIFKDFETSNWTWDPVAKSYYWHRFYSHQPDLNFDNPEVQKAVFKAFDFWMDMGVDGMRLDAVPYLFERENTSCENLPETHAFLKQLRSYINDKYPGTMLLAEANQWPEDAANYFGNGDECHMNFHFPLMPRLFMALRMEDRYSIIDILKQTPEIPENCQWATFLRNHDELTLEMVTDEERDYMYKVYANDPRSRINLGLRRRLAPLVGNDRRQIELLNGLLFSLPGSPIIYYGDELGMGDNIYLGDRDGVRTPFQWSLDRNAGFSKADPQKLYLPLISTPEYHLESINVENLKANPNSLLWWMRKLIALRSSTPVLSRGKLEFVDNSNPKVLTYLRQHEGEVVLCVVNLSRNAQYVEVDLARFKGATPLELFGQSEFPQVTERPYILTMSPYSFYWMQMPEQQTAEKIAWRAKQNIVEVDEDPLASIAKRITWEPLEKNLRTYFARSRWFAGKGRKIQYIERVETIDLQTASKSYLTLLKVHYQEGLPEHYLVGLGHASGEKAQKMLTERPHMVIAETTGKEPGVFFDAILDGEFSRAVMTMIMKRQKIAGAQGKLTAEFTGDAGVTLPEPTFGSAEQSNTSLLFGKCFYLKFYRRIDEGENPEIEIGRLLASQNFQKTAPYLGNLSYKKEGNAIFSLAIVQQVVENEGDGWSLMVGQVGQIAERILTGGAAAKVLYFPAGGLADLRDAKPPAEIQEIAGYTLGLARLLGTRTAEMHLALGSEEQVIAFVPEAYTPFHQRSVFQSFRNLADKILLQLKSSVGRLEGESLELANRVLDAESKIYGRFSFMKDHAIDAARIRTHGDFHLGQVLFTGQDFRIVDFEGEPARGIGERKLKRSPLRDVAGMLRSFQYAAEFYLKNHVLRDHDRAQIETTLRVWAAWAGLEFLNAYLDKMGDSPLLPKDVHQVEALVDMFTLEKSLYEVGYELRSRPDWVLIPLRGVLNVLRRDLQ